MEREEKFNLILDDIIDLLPLDYQQLDDILFNLMKEFEDMSMNDKLMYIIDNFLSLHEVNYTSHNIDAIIDFLELQKTSDGFYKDINDKKCAFDNNKSLKSVGAELPLKLGHEIELYKCNYSFTYFKTNYCLIKLKSGFGRGEYREYIERLTKDLEKHEKLVLLWPRRYAKSVSVGLWVLWKAIFRPNHGVGIAANQKKLAKEYLYNIKTTFMELPYWLTQGIIRWNTDDVEFENKSRIITSATNGDSFRGFQLNTLIIDEMAFINNNLWDEFEDSVFPTLDMSVDKQVIISSTPGGLNHFYSLCKGANTFEVTKMNLKPNDLIEIDGVEMYVKDLYQNFNIIKRPKIIL